MRVLITTQPAYGHLHPLVPLARALADGGAEILFATSGSFRAEVAAAGFASVAVGIDWLESDIAATFPAARGLDQAAGLAFIYREVFAGATARAALSDLLRIGASWRPDLLVREPWEFAGGAAARALGIPSVVHGIGRWASHTEVTEVAAAELGRLTELAGLPPDDLSRVDGELYLDPCPTTLDAPAPRPKPAAALALRPEPFDRAAIATAPDEWLRAPLGRRLVYVGLGTVMHRRPGVLESILEGLAGLEGIAVLVTAGPGRDLRSLGSLPASVRVANYVPLGAVLPRCAVAVCHGGWNTVISAVSRAVPLVCVPLGADGFTTAARCAAAGLAVDLAGSPLTPQAVADATRQVLGDPVYRASAGDLRAEILRRPAAAEIAGRVLELV